MTISEKQPQVWVLIPAAGIGSRMGSDIPKQYLTIHSKTILEHTISCFTELPQVVGILVVVSSTDSYWQNLSLQGLPLNDASKQLLFVTSGGQERSDTVYQGLEYLQETLGLSEAQWVMVHDAARPCVRRCDLDKLLAACHGDACGAILAAPVKDTMKRAFAQGKQILQTESREDLWHALTPQMFRLGQLTEAIRLAKKNQSTITDEASAMEYLGEAVLLVEGASDNIKLTTKTDLPLIEFLLSEKVKVQHD